MRPHFIFKALPILALAASPLMMQPAFAQSNAAINFVAGTGQTEAVPSEASPYVQDVAVAAPSFARGERPQRDAAAELIAMGDQMADPAVQDNVASVVGQMTNTMMRLPIGKFAAAIEDARPGTLKKRIRRDATVADLAGRDGEDLSDDLAQGSRQMMGMMGGFAKAFAVMVPELEKMSREMESSMAQIKARKRR